MSIKDAALRFGSTIETELIQIKADQMEQGQQLTDRVNGVADRVKKVDAKLTRHMEVQADHNRTVVELLMDIQRKLDEA